MKFVSVSELRSRSPDCRRSTLRLVANVEGEELEQSVLICNALAAPVRTAKEEWLYLTKKATSGATRACRELMTPPGMEPTE